MCSVNLSRLFLVQGLLLFPMFNCRCYCIRFEFLYYFKFCSYHDLSTTSLGTEGHRKAGHWYWYHDKVLATRWELDLGQGRRRDLGMMDETQPTPHPTLVVVKVPLSCNVVLPKRTKTQYITASKITLQIRILHACPFVSALESTTSAPFGTQSLLVQSASTHYITATSTSASVVTHASTKNSTALACLRIKIFNTRQRPQSSGTGNEN